MGIINLQFISDEKIRIDNIYRQLEIIYHISVALDSLDSIGLFTEGESTSTNGNDKHLGNNCYAAMSSAADTIMTLLIGVNKTVTDELREEIDARINDAIKYIKCTDTDRLTAIQNAYETKLKDYMRL